MITLNSTVKNTGNVGTDFKINMYVKKVEENGLIFIGYMFEETKYFNVGESKDYYAEYEPTEPGKYYFFTSVLNEGKVITYCYKICNVDEISDATITCN